jgi:hypothetical protein
MSGESKVSGLKSEVQSPEADFNAEARRAQGGAEEVAA